MQGKRTANRRAAALRQALMLSISSMLVCAMMLVGMTYAWFTDSAVTAVNAIHTGTLNVDLMYSNTPIQQGNANAQRLYSNSKLFQNTNWTPNTVEVVYLAVVNNGSLPVRYSLTLNNVTASTSSETTATTDPLQNFQYVIVPWDQSSEQLNDDAARKYFTDSSSQVTPHTISETSGGVQSKTLAASGAATANPTEYYALILYYNSTATTTNKEANVKLGLRLLAIQNSENVAVNGKNEKQAIEAADTDIDPDTKKPFKYIDVTNQPTTTTPETFNSSETSEN
mgnify:FL=1